VVPDFEPDPQFRAHVLGTLRAEAQNNGGTNADRRRELHGQLDRLRDLYVLTDLTKNQAQSLRKRRAPKGSRLGLYTR
jgi:hypothetical protein